MRHIEKLDLALQIVLEQKTPTPKLDVPSTLFWAYRDSLEAETTLLDFNEVIWEQDIPELIKGLRSCEIAQFTISCGMSNVAKTLWALQQNGCRLMGLIEVNTRGRDWKTLVHNRVPAFLIELTI